MNEQADFLIIGGGIAAASVGYWLAPHGRVVLLERESQPGYHATGRSAALFMESYGTPQVCALSKSSRAFFQTPPAGFSDHPLISPRGAVMVATHGQEALLAEHWGTLRALSPHVKLLDSVDTCALVPVLRTEKVIGGIYDPDAVDIDVDTLLQGYLRSLRRSGGHIVCNAEVTNIKSTGSLWEVLAGAVRYGAPIVINAAGAWADHIAEMAGVPPIGMEPRRRSAFIFAPPAGLATAHWPMAFGIADDWYFKPDAGMLLGSPSNADPVVPQDIQPEELDIAMGIYQIEEMTTLKIHRPTRTWAGLRSFVADGGHVGGFDAQKPGFFWLAAQGGSGIMSSPAMGEACAALVRGLPLPAHIASNGLTPQNLGPARC
ncbi:MAG: FAD-dependent oxidoreductase [Rhodoferax sp.]|nr:FAD-dependent oxidoreductase [Rhodoferax sp.]